MIRQSFCLTALFLLLSAMLIAAGADAPAQDAAGLFLNGTAFLDTDGDGFFSPGEGPLANATVRLFMEGNVTSLATTNQSGQYFFGNLSQSLTAENSGICRTAVGDQGGWP